MVSEALVYMSCVASVLTNPTACAKSLEQLVHVVSSIKYYAAFNVICMGSLLCDVCMITGTCQVNIVVISIKDRAFQSLDLQLSFRMTLIFMTIATITKCSVIWSMHIPCSYMDWSCRGLGSILDLYV